MSENTIHERFTVAVVQARATGAKVRQNVQKCCRSCITDRDLAMPEGSEQPYAYTFGGQGRAIYWSAEGNPVIRTGGKNLHGKPLTKPEDAAYFNHGNGGGQAIADSMRAQGFEVIWDGTEEQCVIVKFPELVPT